MVILRKSFNGSIATIKIITIVGTLYYLYEIGVPSLVYELGKKLITKVKNKKSKFFNFNKKDKKTYGFPFIIKESLDDEIPIQIVIDKENINFKRVTKYVSILMSLTSWVRNKRKKYKNNSEDFDNGLAKAIIEECEMNEWINW